MQQVTRKVQQLLPFILSLCCFSAFAQQKVQFENLSFEQAKLKAQKTGRVVFVDVHGSGSMTSNQEVEQKIFTADSVADYFNKHCVCIRVDMTTEAGKKFAPNLAMLMYPVYVFFDEKSNQLEFLNAAEILKNPGDLMSKARGSLANAETRRANKRYIVFKTEKWQELLAMARKEHKLIFLDAYTEWCRPCILMAKNVFTLDKVADYYNAHFINVSMDMEKEEGPDLAKKYNIRAYPTFLYINGDGEVVYSHSGYQEADPFIEEGKAAVKAGQKDKVAGL